MASSNAPSNVLSLLWRNKESRGVIIQIITMVIVFGLLAVIARNVVINLEAVGKEFSFDFLFWPAGYDIGFSPFIEYTNKSTHFMSGVVGLLNTLLIAFWGCILATILGFIIGIMRLSSNWLVSRVSYIFVEFVRNVPVLIHILAIYAIVVTILPSTKQAISLGGDLFFLSNRGFYIPAPIFESGAGWVGIVLLISIGLVIAFRRWAKRIQDNTGRIYPVFWISLAILTVLPSLALVAIGTPISSDIPALKGFNFQGGMAVKPEFIALWLGLSYYTAAFIAEIVRAGILAVSDGQTEAAHALGVRPNRTLQLIIVPQALRIIVPPLCSQYLNLTKNSSLAIAIGYMDITATLGGISLMQTGKEMETMLIVMGIYLIISLLISSFMNWFNSRIKLTER